MKRIFLIMIMMIPLSGCVPAALVVGAAAGGAIIYDQRSFKTMMEDRSTAQTAQNIMDTDPTLKNNSHINVAVFNHVALLVGQAKNDQLRERAYAYVSNLKHVNRVYNEVTLGKNTSILRRSDDTWLTTKVKSSLLAKPGVESNEFKVVTENGVVYLMGVVSRRQAGKAADVVRRINGVHKVVEVFQYS